MCILYPAKGTLGTFIIHGIKTFALHSMRLAFWKTWGVARDETGECARNLDLLEKHPC